MSRELKWIERITHQWSSPLLDRILPWLTHLGSTVAVICFIVLSGLFSGQPGIFSRLVLLYAIQSLIAYSLKFLVRRPRPPAYLRKDTRLEILDPSFPSVHTVNAFMMSTVLGYLYPDYRILFLLVAAFVGWTRMYLCLHFPTDIIAGGLLGYGVTSIFLQYFHLKIIPN